jgi:hypothetical protein
MGSARKGERRGLAEVSQVDSGTCQNIKGGSNKRQSS